MGRKKTENQRNKETVVNPDLVPHLLFFLSLILCYPFYHLARLGHMSDLLAKETFLYSNCDAKTGSGQDNQGCALRGQIQDPEPFAVCPYALAHFQSLETLAPPARF